MFGLIYFIDHMTYSGHIPQVYIKYMFIDLKDMTSRWNCIDRVA